MRTHQARIRPRPSRHRIAALAAAAGLVAFGCSGEQPAAPTLPTAAPTTSPAEPALDPVETPCLAASPEFTDRGTTSVLGGARPDAQILAGIDWTAEGDCERIIFSFVTARGAPASQIGLSRLEFAPEQGILQIQMPRDVDASAVADALVDADLVERAFVVRGISGDLSVDLHFAGSTPVEARGIILGAPARLVIAVRPAGNGQPIGTSPPTIVDDVVVLSPSPGEVEYPLRVRGYVRTDSGVVTAIVRSSAEPLERRITPADSTDVWGEFALTISEGPEGSVTLVVLSDRTDESGDEVAAMPLVVS